MFIVNFEQVNADWAGRYPFSIGFKKHQNKNKHSKWMTCCIESYCEKIHTYWYPSPLNDFLKIPNPTTNKPGGRGRSHTIKYLYSFHFRFLKSCGFFSDNATTYEIDHCARWDLLFTLYSMNLIDFYIWHTNCLAFFQCKRVRLGFWVRGKSRECEG